MKRYINIENVDVYYTLILKKKKNISIKIDLNGDIVVYAPIGIDDSYIENLLIKKKKWIIKNINIIKNNPYNSNDNIIFLGNKYTIKIEISQKESICLDNEIIYIKSKSKDDKYIQNMLVSWYKEQAKIILVNKANIISEKCKLFPTKIIIKDQKSRWGSCNIRKEIRLNWRLILMPNNVMEYIIIHELCHLKIMNHSNEFWRLVKKYIPNYKECHIWLNQNGRSLISIK